MHDKTEVNDDRRRALLLLGGTGLATVVAACTKPGSTASSASAASGGGAAVTSATPEETAGPYPGDGSNGPNVLNESGVVRNDIRPSFGSYSGSASGVPLTLKLQVLDLKNGANALAGAAVYVWHCDRDGKYSLYTVTNQNYLRGVQVTDANGGVAFTTTFPGCYSGRWPHIHFEVYPDVASATSAGSKLKTSQVALPEDACREVYGTTGYSQSITNLNGTSLDRDMVFQDGWSSELATVTGDTAGGYTASLVVAV